MNRPITERFLPELPSRCFIGLMLIYGFVIVLTYQDYGINPDEVGHMTYGRSVVYWYLSGFQERRIFSWTNTWLYGGFFDTITYLAMQALPLDFFATRHLCTAAMGMLGVLAAYRIGCVLGSKWAGVLAALFLILTPRYYGHAFNNHKDIPFAALYLWSVYWQLKVLRSMPNARWNWVIVTGVVTGFAMGIRVGGVMLLCFAGVFWLLKSWRLDVKRCVLQWLTALIVSYVVMLLFWPWAQTDPFYHPLKALMAFSKFADEHLSFFEGHYVQSTKIPWYYAFKWLLLTLPEFVFAGLLGGLFVVLKTWRSANKDTLLCFVLLVAAGFGPLFYVALSGTPLYNGIRHVLFTLPLLVVLSALGLSFFLSMPNGRARLIGHGVLIVFVSFTLWHMVVLHPHQYTFFNQLFAGGIKKASQNYETDYWDNSYKEAVDWLHSKSHPDEQKKRIFSASSSTHFFLDLDRFELVSDPWAADFYLVSTAIDRHRVVPGDVLHVVRADGVPLLYVLRPNALRRNDSLFVGESTYRLASLGSLYRTAKRDEDALKTFVRALELDSTNTWVHIQAGELYLESDRPEAALAHFQKAHDLMPPNAKVLHKLGMCYDQLGQTDQALRLYAWAVELRPYFNPAYRSLGDLLSREKRYTEALVFYRNIVDVFPESLGDWHRVGIALYHLGEFEAAATAFQNLLAQDPDHTGAWHNLGIMLYEQKKLDESLEAYRKVKELHPDDRRADQMMGKILIAQGQWDLAIETVGKLVQRDSLATDEWLLLAQAHRGKGDLDGAHMALAKYIKHHGNKQDGWLEYFELGKVYHKGGQVEAARVIYQAVKKVLPDNVDVQDRLRSLSP